MRYPVEILRQKENLSAKGKLQSRFNFSFTHFLLLSYIFFKDSLLRSFLKLEFQATVCCKVACRWRTTWVSSMSFIYFLLQESMPLIVYLGVEYVVGEHIVDGLLGHGAWQLSTFCCKACRWGTTWLWRMSFIYFLL